MNPPDPRRGAALTTAPLTGRAATLVVLTDAVAPGSGTDGALSEVAEPAEIISERSRTAEVDAIFGRDESLRCVLVDAERGPVLVDRTWFEAALTGRLGYGRLLHSRTKVVDMVREPTLVLPDGCPLLTAAAALIERRGPGTVSTSLVVTSPDGGLAVAHATAVFERLARHFAHQSVHDPLTGLPNRGYLMEHLRDRRELDRPAVLMYVDLDRFKDVNDQHGHAAGDQVLVQFADRLRAACRAPDVVVRLGGDEFAVLSREGLTPAASAALARRIVLEVAAPFVVRVSDDAGSREVEVSVGASVGVAHADGEDPTAGHLVTSLDVLLRQADLAMHRAKECGRGRSACYDADLRAVTAQAGDATREQHRMERRLRAALDTGALTLHYQPVVELPSARVVGVEALARWQDDELGTVSPDRFIPLAERTGMIVDLGRVVLGTACRQAAAWSGAGLSDLTVSVNVSPVQLARADFPDLVLTTLAAAGLEPQRLCLELTETAAVTDLAQTVAALTTLRASGVRVALDDFGTGHSSLTLLRTLPLDVVKIDRSFVTGVARSAQDAMLIRMVIDTAHTLGLTVCAEGIEHRDQAVQLAALGCDTAQGWHLGMPEPPSDRLLRSLQDPGEVIDLDAAPPVPLTGADELVLVTTPDRTITYASSTSLPLLGLTPQQLVGTNVMDHLLPEVVRRVDAGDEVPGLTCAGQVRHRVVGSHRRIRWFDTTSHSVLGQDGQLLEVMSISRDVTEQAEATSALRLSETRFRHAFDDAPTGMAINDLDGRILQANTAFAEMLGPTTDELVGRTVASITHPEDLATDLENTDLLRAGLQREQHVAKRYLDAEGRAVPVVVRVSLVEDSDLAPGHVVAHVLRDVAADR